MNRKELNGRIGEILDDTARLRNMLYGMAGADVERYPDNYGTLSVGAALRAEKIACRLRSLIYMLPPVRKEEYMIHAAQVHGIRIASVQGRVEIVIPGLLPGKRQKRSGEFLFEPLYYAMSDYARKTGFPHYRDSSVAVVHLYDEKLGTGRMMDYDNLQQKQLLDTVAAFLMEDDGGMRCDLYSTVELGGRDATCVTVMDRAGFPKWLERWNKERKRVSAFV